MTGCGFRSLGFGATFRTSLLNRRMGENGEVGDRRKVAQLVSISKYLPFVLPDQDGKVLVHEVCSVLASPELTATRYAGSQDARRSRLIAFLGDKQFLSKSSHINEEYLGWSLLQAS
jgi:hypothetical protein